MLIDLHIHTNNSDGTDSLNEIIGSLDPRKHYTLGIADHYYLTLPQIEYRQNVTLIPAIEPAVRVNGRDYHFICYSAKPKITPQFKSMLKKYINGYNLRAKKIMEKVGLAENPRDLSLPPPIYTYDILEKELKHYRFKTVAELIDWDRAGPKIFKVEEENFFPDIAEFIPLMNKCNFWVFWAHPGTRFKSPAPPFENDLNTMIKAGLDGIEVFYGNHNLFQIEWLLGYAQKHKLLISGGSDYHGKGRKREQLNFQMPEKYFNWIKLKGGD